MSSSHPESTLPAIVQLGLEKAESHAPGSRQRSLVAATESSQSEFASQAIVQENALEQAEAQVPGSVHVSTVIELLSSQPESAEQAIGQTTILGGTCGLSFPDGSSINYGALSPNQLSSEITLNMTNSGTIKA